MPLLCMLSDVPLLFLREDISSVKDCVGPRRGKGVDIPYVNSDLGISAYAFTKEILKQILLLAINSWGMPESLPWPC